MELRKESATGRKGIILLIRHSAHSRHADVFEEDGRKHPSGTWMLLVFNLYDSLHRVKNIPGDHRVFDVSNDVSHPLHKGPGPIQWSSLH